MIFEMNILELSKWNIFDQSLIYIPSYTVALIG